MVLFGTARQEGRSQYFRPAIAEAPVDAPGVAQALDSIGRERSRAALRQIMGRAQALSAFAVRNSGEHLIAGDPRQSENPKNLINRLIEPNPQSNLESFWGSGMRKSLVVSALVV